MLRVDLLNPGFQNVVLRIFKNIAFIIICKAAYINTFGDMFSTTLGMKGCSDMVAIAIDLLAISHFVLIVGARGVAHRSKCHLSEDSMMDNKKTKIILNHPGTNNFAGVEYFRVLDRHETNSVDSVLSPA